MSRSFEPNLPFRALQAALSIPVPVIERLLGEPVVMDRQRLDPHVQYLLWTMQRSPLTAYDAPGLDLATRRAYLDRDARLGMPLARGVAVEAVAIEGPGGPIPARTYRADGIAPQPPVLLYFHGGGWVLGGLDSHEALARMLARITRTLVVSVDYRLAPEHPHPAAVQDCLAAYDWALEHGPALGARPGAVAVVGDSAGGNLAAVVSAAVRDRGTGPVPIAQGLIYPATDLRMGHRSHGLFSQGLYLTGEQMRWYRAQYAPEPEHWLDPTVSPLLAERFDGLPPTLVVTAGFDPLRDEGEEYGRALAAAGVPVVAHRVADQVHGFVNMGMLPGGLQRAAAVCRQVGDLVWRHSGT